MSRVGKKREKRENPEHLKGKQCFRLKLTASAMTILIVLLGGRLYYLQVVCHRSLGEAAEAQYRVEIQGLDTRGQIFDRNMEPLTGGSRQYLWFLESEKLDEEAGRLLSAVNARCISIGQKSRYRVYRSRIFDETVNRKLKEDYGAYALCTRTRCSDSQPACHLIGYLNESEKKGVSGLEKACESRLSAADRKLMLRADSTGKLMLGIEPELTGKRSLREGSLVTSLDLGLQNTCETLLKNSGSTGAILVSDLDSGEVLAWASAPVFNPNSIEEYLSDGSDCLVDKCVQGLYAPGSLFKLVVAAAALEAGTVDPDAEYECRGSERVGGITLGCRLGPAGGHGMVNMKEAMASSCNCYFAVLGEKTGAERILAMARRLGLGQPVFCHGNFRLEEESAGFLPTAQNLGVWDISNLSIGQGSLQVTPAQMHRLLSVIGRGGRRTELTPLKDRNRITEVRNSSPDQGEALLSVSSAEKLKEMLRSVMEEGTGKRAGRSTQVWGKTGTAETVRGGKAVCDCWCSGWCSTGENEFAITVLVESGVSGGASALPLFDEIAEYLSLRQIKTEKDSPSAVL